MAVSEINTRVPVKLNKNLKSHLETLAIQENRSFSSLVESILMDWCSSNHPDVAEVINQENIAFHEEKKKAVESAKREREEKKRIEREMINEENRLKREKAKLERLAQARKECEELRKEVKDN